MSNYDNTNRGQIWPNERKEKDTHPDFTGSINIDGVEYFLDAWKRRPDANPKAPSLSFRVKRKDKQPQQSQPQYGDDQTQPSAASGAAGDGFDDIPF